MLNVTPTTRNLVVTVETQRHFEQTRDTVKSSSGFQLVDFQQAKIMTGSLF